MKKRLLALALCLVMAVSLLPITAAANVDRIHITGSGFGTTAYSYYGGLQDCKCNVTVDGNLTTTGFGYNGVLFRDKEFTLSLLKSPIDGETYYLEFTMTAYDSGISYSQISKDDCVLEIDGYSTACVELDSDPERPNNLLITFQVTKNHNWQFTVSKNNDTLTAQCQNQECRKEVNVTLKADSVTLPTNPFNAWLEGWEQFQDAIPTAYYEKLVYKYNGPNGWTEVKPTAANAKAGEYQVGVQILGLPDKENGPVARSLADGANADGAGYADLYVQYTVADPKVTAQTGDNRPIELMMAGAAVFSALAAAAFILDNKRKYRQ